MECFHCKQKIDESKPHEVSVPDGDVLHLDCLKEYEKEREKFLIKTIYDDKKFANYMGIPQHMFGKEG